MLTYIIIYGCLISTLSCTVSITCNFEQKQFNSTIPSKTCKPEPFIVVNSTDFAQLPATDNDCEAFYVKKSESTHLPLGLSTFLPNLKIFIFKASNLTEIHQYSMENLTQLIEVSFYKNSLTKIKTGIFSDNKLIRKVSFGANKIDSIDVDAFKGLKELREIYLNSNELEVLDAELFRYNQQLTVIDLELNKLKELPITIFNGLSNLRSINLNNNDLEDLPGRIFKDNSELEVLKISQNLVTKTDIQSMTFFDELKIIDVLDNPCTEELHHNTEISELKDFLDEQCKADCDDRYKWLLKENEELSRSYKKVLDLLDKAEENVTTIPEISTTDEDDQSTDLPN